MHYPKRLVVFSKLKLYLSLKMLALCRDTSSNVRCADLVSKPSLKPMLSSGALVFVWRFFAWIYSLLYSRSQCICKNLQMFLA